MAKFHKGSNNLVNRSNESFIIGSLIAILVAVTVYLVFINKIAVVSWYYFLPVMLGLVVAWYFIRRGVILRYGAKGETAGQINALNLPEDYHVFTNLNIAYQNHSQEVDLIIVGIKGVYVVEVKNHNGNIVGDSAADHLTQYKIGRGGGKYSKDISNPVKQVKGQVYKLSKMLKEHGINVWVDGVVMFTNSAASINIKNSTVPILYPGKRLDQYILNCKNRQYLNKTLINKVVEVLTSLQ